MNGRDPDALPLSKDISTQPQNVTKAEMILFEFLESLTAENELQLMRQFSGGKDIPEPSIEWPRKPILPQDDPTWHPNWLPPLEGYIPSYISTYELPF